MPGAGWRRGSKWLAFQVRSLLVAGRGRTGSSPSARGRSRAAAWVALRVVLTVLALYWLWPFLWVTVLAVEEYEEELSSVQLLRRALRSKEQQQANFEMDTEPPESGGIAFALQVCAGNVHMVPRLLKALYSPFNSFMITLDTSVTEMQHSELRHSLATEPQIAQVTGFMPVTTINPHGISAVLATMDAMEQLLEFSANWTHLINLEPYDYPLVSAGKLRKVLHAWNESLLFDISNEDDYYPKPIKEDGIELSAQVRLSQDQEFYVFDGSAAVHNPASPSQTQSPALTRASGTRNEYVYYQRFDTASADPHMIITRDFAEFCIASTFAKKILLNFANVLHPARHFFPTTALAYPKFSTRVISVPLGAYANPLLPRSLALNATTASGSPASVFWDGGTPGAEAVLFSGEGRLFASPFRGTDTAFRHVIDEMTRGALGADSMWARWGRAIAKAAQAARARPPGRTVDYIHYEEPVKG